MAVRAKILVIDDDPDYRASTRVLLESRGYAVIEAGSGQEGLAAARQHRPDLIVLDVMMDSMSEGYSVRQALTTVPEFQEMEPIPVIMASSIELDPEAMFGWIGDTSSIRPDAYMSKPLDIPQFLEHVEQLIAARRDQ